jgi:hypothetical protein
VYCGLRRVGRDDVQRHEGSLFRIVLDGAVQSLDSPWLNGSPGDIPFAFIEVSDSNCGCTHLQSALWRTTR